jgi:hypothetical protein
VAPPKKQQSQTPTSTENKPPRDDKPPRVGKALADMGILTPAAAHDELPVIDAIGWTRVKGGWVPLRLQVQGGTVIGCEVLTQEPVRRAYAAETMKIKLITDLLPAGAQVEA